MKQKIENKRNLFKKTAAFKRWVICPPISGLNDYYN